MMNTIQIEDIKKEHATLYTHILSEQRKHPEKFKKGPDRDQFLSNAHALVHQLNEMAGKVRYVDDYTWLSSALVQWQIAFSSVLEEPLMEQIPDPRKGLRTSYPDKKINTEVKRYAGLASLFRRLSRDSTDEERSMDWYQAEVILALDILDAKIDLVQGGEQAFNHLQAAWLNEVIKVKAYFRHQDRERKVQELNDHRENFFYACEYYRWRLISAREKYDPEYFDDVSLYIQTYFLNHSNKRLHFKEGEELISRKAERYHKNESFKDRHMDWAYGELYVKLFYENIVPAVMEADEAAKGHVVEAILLSEGPNRLSVMNAFEAAIAIYFLRDLKGLPPEWYEQAEAFKKRLEREQPEKTKDATD